MRRRSEDLPCGEFHPDVGQVPRASRRRITGEEARVDGASRGAQEQRRPDTRTCERLKHPDLGRAERSAPGQDDHFAAATEEFPLEDGVGRARRDSHAGCRDECAEGRYRHVAPPVPPTRTGRNNRCGVQGQAYARARPPYRTGWHRPNHIATLRLNSCGIGVSRSAPTCSVRGCVRSRRAATAWP